jgi:DNA repair exonuclease SbcCD ATPase subunit
MITLRTLRWGNVFSYGDNNVIHLDRDILTQIVGTNGTGKSSIPLILEEVLFNKNSKGIKKSAIPNRHIKMGYWISLDFDKDKEQYEIYVNRKTSIKVILKKNGEDISSHTATGTYKTIQELLGVDFKTFSQLVYQNTNASLQFLTATDTNRKKFLIDLLHLEEYVKIFEVFKDAARELNSETTGVTAQIATITKWMNDNKLADTNILPMLNLEINTESEEEEVGQLTTQIANISADNKKVTQNNQYKLMLEKVDLNAANSIKATEKLSYDSLQSEVGGLAAQRKAAEVLVAKLHKLGDTCHVCNQDIDPSSKEESTIKELNTIALSTKSINDLRENINEIKQNNTDFARKKRIQKEWEDLYRSVDLGLSSNLLDVVELRRRLDSVQTVLRTAKADIASTARENQSRTKRNTRIQVILEQTEAFQTELDSCQKSLNSQVALLSNLEVLKKAFSTNGLLAYKIENMVKDLEDLVNTYLGELSSGKFTLEFVVTNDKLNVEITDDGEPVEITELSTGELARVNTATLLAIRKLMSSISKSKINVLFLDEVISVLDDEGKEKLVEVLLQEKGLNTYAVSHGWTHPLLEKITVQKRNKISYLET